ncbi:uncharacterized protein LOC113324394 [Papaver somniferum]|uniref:uncharacterized protein LOC113324394 n=1 Tax=Papaver somniferum TaxID=3469 RepID=UPI000E703B51|nr:uncharacterized protein LOC113324394 [Papaver somniferum]
MATKQSVVVLTSTVTQNTTLIQEVRDELNSLKSTVYDVHSKLNTILSLLVNQSQPQSDPQDTPDPSGESQFDPVNSFSNLRHIINSMSPNNHSKFSRTPKVDFPRFNGSNPRGWALKCERYFSFHKFLDEERVDMAAIHFDSQVDSWFMNYQQDITQDNYVGSFNKLTQATTVEDYFDKWEHYKGFMVANNPTLPESFYTLSFISGLKEDIRASMQMFKPETTTEAFVLARMQQASLLHHPKPPKTFSRPFVPAKLSNFRSSEVTPYCGSSGYWQHHSFIDSNIAKKLHIHTSSTGHMVVAVANGDNITSHGLCQNLQWEMQGHGFSNDLRVLPLGGYDMVLGADWLQQLGDVTFNFSQLSISFLHQGRHITLQGSSSKPSLNLIDGSSIRKFIKANTPTLIGKFFVVSASPPPHIPPPISAVLDTFPDIFAEPTTLPPLRIMDHKIPLKPHSTPTSQRPCKFPYIHKSVVEQLVKEMLSTRLIKKSNSPFASPILLVKKKYGTRRFCVNYRKINELKIKDKFPIPLIDELLDELKGAVIFSKIDLRSGYFQIRVFVPDIYKTAFRTHHGHYEFKVVPFGLTNAPATFQALMNEVFQPFLRNFVIVSFDDILNYRKSMEDHVLHLQQVFFVLRQHSLYAKLSKCVFAQPQLYYLCHLISAEGVAADPDKITAMTNWPFPANLKQLRGFLGLTVYYRRFIRGYGTISKPLTDMLKKYAFHWSPSAHEAFNILKIAMTKAQRSGSSAHARRQTIIFSSKALGPKTLSLSTYDKEFLAIVMVVQKWRYYLSHSKFIIKTDHQSLQYLMDQKISTTLQQKWLVELMGFDYIIQYKKGKDNVVADAFSKTHDIISSYDGDAEAQQLIASLLVSPDQPKFSYSSGIIRFKGRLYIGSSNECNKGGTSFPSGLLQPLLIPEQAWQDISMDYIEGLPLSNKKSVILALFKSLGTTIKLSTTYHPQTDGQTERTNACVELCMVTNPPLIFPILSTTSVASVENYLKERDVMLQLLKEDLAKAQARMNAEKSWSSGIQDKLPIGSQIHPIFHVSQLKKQIGVKASTLPFLPVVDDNGHFVVEPVDVWSSRHTLRGTIYVPQLLIQWSKSTAKDAT